MCPVLISRLLVFLANHSAVFTHVHQTTHGISPNDSVDILVFLANHSPVVTHVHQTTHGISPNDSVDYSGGPPSQ